MKFKSIDYEYSIVYLVCHRDSDGSDDDYKICHLVAHVTSAHAKGATHHKFFEIGSEREEIFIPGDPIHVDDLKDCGDDDEF